MKFRARSSLISLLFWQLQLFTVCRAEEASKFAHDLFPLGRPIKKPFHISSYARDGVDKFKHDKEDIQGNDTTAERLGFSYKVPEVETQRDHVIPYGHVTKKSRDHSHYGSSVNSYAYSASRHDVDAIGHKDTTNNFISENDAHQVIAGIPDLSDPCFRRYANTIIVNAQPYERRSSISLINCKRRCLDSQIGVYSCRSFVYDNINQVCDLFPHVGDQSPARLLRFQTRDYFEPTSAISCTSSNFEAIIASTTTVFPPTAFPTEETTVSAAPSTVVEIFRDENSSVEQENTPTPFQPVPDFDLLIGTGVGPQSCKEDQIARFLKTQDFSLDGHDDLILENTSLDDCIRFCLNNFVNGSAFKCSSFDYSPNKCILSTEVAVPLGNGQLKQNVDIAYYEKVCVDEQLAKDCPIVYNRFPQKILVGFAETVIDTPTLQECFDNCLNSQKLYGFRCTSGMYYFEEAQLNCILNTEDRTTQSELFASENTDLVDYFETGCNRTSSNANRRFASYAQRSMAKSRDFIEPTKFASKISYKWTEWSSCNGNSPKQTRKKICQNGKICGQEERLCPTHNNDLEPEQLLNAIRKAKCVMDKCCKIFNHCKVGIIQDSTTMRLEWCTNPCH